MAAGLGGGSSDAAAVLLGLNRLWGLRWSLPKLAEVAIGLGMDVPFFLRGGAAVGRGRGEQLEPLAAGPTALVLVNPRFGVATAEAYGHATPGMYTDGARARAVAAAVRGRNAGRLAAALYNGLEGAVMPLAPDVQKMKAALVAAGALGAIMSGSGPTVLGVCRSFEQARQVRGRLARASWECWAVRTLIGPAIRLPRRPAPAGEAGG